MILYQLVKWMEERNLLKHKLVEAKEDRVLLLHKKEWVEEQVLQASKYLLASEMYVEVENTEELPSTFPEFQQQPEPSHEIAVL